MNYTLKKHAFHTKQLNKGKSVREVSVGKLSYTFQTLRDPNFGQARSGRGKESVWPPTKKKSVQSNNREAQLKKNNNNNDKSRNALVP